MIQTLLKVASEGKSKQHFVESYCKLKRNKSILQRITACTWTNR